MTMTNDVLICPLRKSPRARENAKYPEDACAPMLPSIWSASTKISTDFGSESSPTCFSRIHLRTAAHEVKLRLNCEYPLVWTLESWRTGGVSRAVATRAAGGGDPRRE